MLRAHVLDGPDAALLDARVPLKLSVTGLSVTGRVDASAGSGRRAAASGSTRRLRTVASVHRNQQTFRFLLLLFVWSSLRRRCGFLYFELENCGRGSFIPVSDPSPLDATERHGRH